MKYILDTDTLSYLSRKDGQVRSRFIQTAMQHAPEDIAITIFTYAEIMYGYHWTKQKRPHVLSPELLLSDFPIIPFDLESSRCYASLKATLRMQGQLIGEIDMLIAAVTIVNHAALVTNNTKDFSRIEGLKIENWKQ